MLRLAIAPGSRPSGTIMGQLLRARGVLSDPSPGMAVVSWGVPMAWNARTLNARQPTDKLAELKALRAGLVDTVEYAEEPFDGMKYSCWFARKKDHHGGTDIIPVWSREEAEWRKAAGWSFFTKRLDVAREFRVWVFRGRLLGIYEKLMKYPERYRGIGRNYKNGFAFNLAKGLEADLSWTLHHQTDAALTALGLDFGAADVVQTTDGDLRVLEVNTAPGIESVERRAPNLLADCIVQWYRGL